MLGDGGTGLAEAGLAATRVDSGPTDPGVVVAHAEESTAKTETKVRVRAGALVVRPCIVVDTSMDGQAARVRQQLPNIDAGGSVNA